MTDTPEGKNIVDTERYKYTRTMTKIGDKNVHSKDNGDAVAVALRGVDTAGLVAILGENNMLDDRYRKYAETMSPGRFRMTAGQALRYRWKRGEVTVVNGRQLAAPPAAPEAKQGA